MGTSNGLIKTWLKRGDKEKHSHMLVVCDTYDYDDYPVLVLKSESITERIKNYNCNMQRVVEVYNYSMDIDEQLNTYRAYNI